MKPARAFAYRAGVRIEGTVLACDASGGRDLTFVSSAQVTPPRGRAQVLATETTLALLGRAGRRLRASALLAAPGRPFLLGALRVEIYPSGLLPGAASLLVEARGRRIAYAGAVRPGPASVPAVAMEIRGADAVCLGAAFGNPHFSFPPRDEALAAATAFATAALGAGRAPVLLAAPMPTALEVGAALAAAGVALRAHRSIVAAAASFRAAGLPAAPIARFGGRLGPGEALLWPPEERTAPRLAALDDAAFVLCGGAAADPDATRALSVEAAIALAPEADHAGLLAYVEATGASEVAVTGRFAEDLATTLRARGLDAYPLGPPEQMRLC